MEKRGISNVLIAVLLVLLVIVAIILLWFFIAGSLKSSSKKVIDENRLRGVQCSIIKNSVVIDASQNFSFLLQLESNPPGKSVFPVVVTYDNAGFSTSTRKYNTTKMNVYNRVSASLTQKEHQLLNTIQRIEIYPAFVDDDGSIVVAQAPCDEYVVPGVQIIIGGGNQSGNQSGGNGNNQSNNQSQQPNYVYLTLNVTPTGAGAVLDINSQPYGLVTQVVYGTTITLTPTPAQDYIFDHWNEQGANAGTIKPFVINMTTNRSLEAVFNLAIIYLNGCGLLNVPNGHYKLVSNIQFAVGTCFSIVSDNITLDGNGHIAVYNGEPGTSSGIFMSNVLNATVKNITLSSFPQGILLTKTNSSHILDSKISGSLINNYGILFNYSSLNDVQGNIIVNNHKDGIYIISGSGNFLSSNNVSGNAGNGISLSPISPVTDKVQTNTVDGNFVGFNFLNGIFLFGSTATSNTLSNNNLASNSLSGIFVNQSLGNNFIANKMCFNTLQDFNCWNSLTGSTLGNTYIKNQTINCDSWLVQSVGSCP